MNTDASENVDNITVFVWDYLRSNRQNVIIIYTILHMATKNAYSDSWAIAKELYIFKKAHQWQCYVFDSLCLFCRCKPSRHKMRHWQHLLQNLKMGQTSSAQLLETLRVESPYGEIVSTHVSFIFCLSTLSIHMMKFYELLYELFDKRYGLHIASIFGLGFSLAVKQYLLSWEQHYHFILRILLSAQHPMLKREFFDRLSVIGLSC